MVKEPRNYLDSAGFEFGEAVIGPAEIQRLRIVRRNALPQYRVAYRLYAQLRDQIDIAVA
jgi:hypothetical protein